MGVVPSRTSSLSARTVSRDLGHLRSRGSPGSSDPFVRTASASLGVVTGTEDVAGAGRGHACKKAGEVGPFASPPSLADLSADTHQLFMRLCLPPLRTFLTFARVGFVSGKAPRSRRNVERRDIAVRFALNQVLLPRHTAGGAVGTLSLSAHLLLPLSRSLFPLVSLEAQGFDSQCEASYSAVSNRLPEILYLTRVELVKRES
ncbi:hypothetical protein BHE74_00059518 [Ensete ventricosum]|nr:hypothetical protein BHE74_00059518 [Ensete ventricosum]RZS12121.1 hypothetical protein BHM03_00043511 [Ensete ventricosum]